jgi:TonB family protein
MYFDFEDGHPDLERVPSALTSREGVLLSIIAHLMVVILILVLPQLPFFKARAAAAKAAAQAARQAMLERQRDQQRFVFVQPRVEMPPSKPAPTAPLADRDRSTLTRERPPHPTNLQPFSRGNTPEFVEKSPPPSPAQGNRQPGPPEPQPAQPSPAQAANPADAFRLPRMADRPPAPSDSGQSARPASGALSEAIRNLSRYAEQAAFDNPNGGQGTFGPSLQFDTKGVEFGPWVRRFLAQLKRNWYPLIPNAAMSLRGHVSITFDVHKNGALTDVTVIAPSAVDGFNNAAYNALLITNPTEPLPPEYPSDKAFITITFFYNELPPQGP